MLNEKIVLQEIKFDLVKFQWLSERKFVPQDKEFSKRRNKVE